MRGRKLHAELAAVNFDYGGRIDGSEKKSWKKTVCAILIT